jgi:hypothetical protein
MREKERVYLPADPYLLKHYDFKLGTYWIYKDTISGRVDSFVVTERKDTTQMSYIEDKIITYQRIGCKIAEYHSGLLYDTIYWGIGIYANGLTFSNSISGGGESSLKNAIKTSVTLQGTYYDNVYEFFSGSKLFYVKDDIGFIRFYFVKFIEPINVWELVRYNIII